MAKCDVKQTQENHGMNKLELIDARCRVEQAQAVLSVLLEERSSNDREVALIGAVMSLLELVPEAMEETECELADYVMRNHLEGKS
ncbi:hypothetical protein [Serratia sp. UGAL515B_01]|uniref:hypothetical protein n=1 Tax=Serratia sp. UGAL515B_01 TaxID=2986763 RepID=UPI002953C30A|nr:hypothetical protein [Serratia sp. UGAL515B_01]WON77026.1 hypothetical protein OK023_17955 [Serratia sp. UGAL515B_01]